MHIQGIKFESALIFDGSLIETTHGGQKDSVTLVRHAQVWAQFDGFEELLLRVIKFVGGPVDECERQVSFSERWIQRNCAIGSCFCLGQGIFRCEEAALT